MISCTACLHYMFRLECALNSFYSEDNGTSEENFQSGDFHQGPEVPARQQLEAHLRGAVQTADKSHGEGVSSVSINQRERTGW